MADEAEELRILLLQIPAGSILVPDTAMAETVARPTWTPAQRDEWVLGEVEWRGLSIPLTALDVLFGDEPPDAPEYVAVMNTSRDLGDDRAAFYAVMLKELPRLVRLRRDDLDETRNRLFEAGPFRGIRTHFNGGLVIIPDLTSVETALAEL